MSTPRGNRHPSLRSRCHLGATCAGNLADRAVQFILQMTDVLTFDGRKRPFRWSKLLLPRFLRVARPDVLTLRRFLLQKIGAY